MDTSTKENDAQQKKVALENLEKQEIIKKYKNLLIIAQKAKQAKDEAIEETKRLKEQVGALRSKGDATSEGEVGRLLSELNTMQETLSTMTEQKLSLTVQLDYVKKQLEDARQDAKTARAQACELETVAESCQRQMKRLTDDNDSLMEKMLGLEQCVEAAREELKKVADSRDAERRTVAALRSELVIHQEETDRLTTETKKKNEQMKELYDKFAEEKRELEAQLETMKRSTEQVAAKLKCAEEESEALITRWEEDGKFEVDSLKQTIAALNEKCAVLTASEHALTQQLQNVSEERAAVLADVGNVKQNNLELSQLLQNINAERDACLQNVTKYKQLLEKLAMEKECICKENVCLKSDIETLGDNLHSVKAEKEVMENDFNIIAKNLQQFDDVLGHWTSRVNLNSGEDFDLHSDNHSYQLPENPFLSTAVTSVNRNISKTCSLLRKLEMVVSTEANMQKEISQNMVFNSNNRLDTEADVRNSYNLSTGGKELARLYSELEHLSVVVSNMEEQGQFLEVENKKLKDDINYWKSLSVNCVKTKQTELEHQDNEEGRSLENDACLGEVGISEQKCFTVDNVERSTKDVHFLDRLRSCRNQEMAQVKGQSAKMDKPADWEVETGEESLREALYQCRQQLSEKSLEIGLLKEELSHLLQQQSAKEIRIMGGTTVCKEVAQQTELEETQLVEGPTALTQQKINCELSSEVMALQKKLSKYSSLISKKNNEIELYQRETEILKNSVERSNRNEVELQKQIIVLQRHLTNESGVMDGKCVDLDLRAVEEEVKKCNQESESDNAEIQKLNEERLILLRDISDKCILVDHSISEVESLKKVTDSLQVYLEEAKHKNHLLHSELNTTAGLLQEKTLACNSLSGELAGTCDILKAANDEISNQATDLLKLKEHLDCKNNEIKRLNIDIETLHKIQEEECEKIQNDLVTSEKNNAAYLQDISRLQESLLEANKVEETRLLEFEELKHELQKYHQGSEDKTNQLDSLDDQLKHVEIVAGLNTGTQETEATKTVSGFTMDKGEMAKNMDGTRSAVVGRRTALEDNSGQLQEMRRPDRYEQVVTTANKLRATVDKLRSERDELRGCVTATAQLIALTTVNIQEALQASAAASRKENSEMLSEMNEMNQVLKQRGETISKLREQCRDVEAKLQETCVKLATTASELQTRNDEAEVSKAELSSVKAELAQVSQQYGSAVLSLEESCRKNQELETKVCQLEADESHKEGEARSDVMSSSTISRAEECSRLKDLEETFEERYTKLRAVAVRLKKRLAEQSAQLVQLEADKKRTLSERTELLSKLTQATANAKNLQMVQQEYDRLQDELETQNSEMKGLQKSLEAATSELSLARRELEQRQEEKRASERRCAELVLEVEAARQEAKRGSVLSLEMQDYERSVAELTQQLVVERAKIKELEVALEGQRHMNRQLEEQVSLLQQRALEEESRSLELQEQLSTCQLRMAESEVELEVRAAQISEVVAQVEQQREVTETLTMQLSQLAADKNRLGEMARTQQEAAASQVCSLEEQRAHLSEVLAGTQAELARVKTEFEGYKVRAQSVLRQRAVPLAPDRDESEQELGLLRHALDGLQLQLQAALAEQAAISQERDAALQCNQDLQQSVSELKEQKTQLNQRLQHMSMEHREALHSQRMQHETLVHCYKKQVEQLEQRLSNETSSLQQQLSSVEEQLATLQGSSFVPVKVVPLTTHELDMPLLEREEGEGSESVNSASPQLVTQRVRHQELVPLDKLLACTEEDNGHHPEEMTPTSASTRQIQHLTALLNDAERDLARLAQQNGVLKEEIRRQQRSDERTQHAHNFEYLKNVVLKFVTLQGGDERTRLVPVLNTILKLSPEETSQLQAVARSGGDGQGPGRGWGSYLPLWHSATP